jgi:hypothetical protein
MGHGMLAVIAIGKYRHLQPVFKAPAYIPLYASVSRLWAPPHYGHILALGRFVEKLPPEMSLGIGSLGHDKQSGCVLVDTVHKPHARVIDIILGIILEVIGQRIDKSTVVIAVAGMHYQSGGFIDHKQMLVFIYDVERYILGYYLQFITGAVHDHSHHIKRLYPVIGLDRTTVDKYASCVGSLLHTVARRLFKTRHKKLVDTQKLLPLVGYESEMLVKLASVSILDIGVISVTGNRIVGGHNIIYIVNSHNTTVN